MENVPTNPRDVAQPVKIEKATSDRLENLASNKNEWTKIEERVTIEEAKQKLIELNENLKEGLIPWRLPTEDEIIQLFRDNSDTHTEEYDIMGLGMKEEPHYFLDSDTTMESDCFFATSNKDVTKIITPHYSKFPVYSGGGIGPHRGERLEVRGLKNFYSDRSSVIFTREKAKPDNLEKNAE